MEDERIVLTVDEAAKLMRISRPSAFQGIRRGQIPHIRIGRRILIPRVALERMLSGQWQPTTASARAGG